MRLISPMNLALGNALYCCINFNEINGDDTFQFLEDCQHEPLYCPATFFSLDIQ